TTEHKAMLDPLRRLERRGFEVTYLQPSRHTEPTAGRLDVQQVADTIRDDTLLVSVMLANNEMGVLQPLAEIGAICRERGVLLHSDATQAVGKIPVDVEELSVDLLSFSAHKMYGPKGVGGLYVRRRAPNVRLAAQIEGGGQEQGLRSGTLNVPGIVGLATCLQLAAAELTEENHRLRVMRDRLAAGLREQIAEVTINGPALETPELRLPGNLNVSFAGVDGEALMLSMQDLAVSSGSACTSSNPEPSHVLRALGIHEEAARSSLRFGLGRFNTDEEVEFAIQTVADAVDRLRQMRG
ncbi:MAG: aminotransferase class V-fold PLP-dependent enzyme, partial [Planctomycetales bacterium]|nr:aminotransferase class V-fold PLP-dependent enzyme [Planctomycetales bacterium]